MPFSRPLTVSNPPPLAGIASAIAALIYAALIGLLALAAMTWREDAVGSVARVMVSMIGTALLVAGHRP